MAVPYRPMLPPPSSAPPVGEGWVHECELDGYCCVAQVSRSRVRLWSGGGVNG
jgi:hypothetical protein